MSRTPSKTNRIFEEGGVERRWVRSGASPNRCVPKLELGDEGKRGGNWTGRSGGEAGDAVDVVRWQEFRPPVHGEADKGSDLTPERVFSAASLNEVA